MMNEGSALVHLDCEMQVG